MDLNRFRWVIPFVVLLVLVLLLQSNPVYIYTEALVANSYHAIDTSDPLYQQIILRAKELEQEAIEPRVDRIWKLIPGYNGITVDVEATYKNANRRDGTFTPVIKETSPQKTVWDLPPNPIYRGNVQKKMVAFMINVAWGNEHLESILKTLADHNIRATFFLDGSWVAKNSTLAKQIVNDGHEIGSHAYSHPMMSRLTKDRIIEEMEKTNRTIKEALAIDVSLFAPPSGDYDERVVKLAWERKMLTILWTLDTVDWRNPPAKEMANKIIKNVNSGNLILMHPTPATAQALNDMIIGVQNKGYAIDVVSEVISSDRTGRTRLPSDF